MTGYLRRWDVHFTVTDEIWSDADPVISVTLMAGDSDFAEMNARALLHPDLSVDTCEVELAADEVRE